MLCHTTGDALPVTCDGNLLRVHRALIRFADGEVRYKSSVDFEGSTLSPVLIRNTMYPAVQTMDRYWPGIMSVVYGGRSPEEAITAVEEQ